VTYLSIGVGVALILGGFALVAIALLVYRWAKRVYANTAPAAAAV
jgi:hypothetical protein